MISKIILRYCSPTNKIHAYKIADIIASYDPSLSIDIVDHSNLSLDDFKGINKDSTLISIDKHISTLLKIPYYRISRIFDVNGNVLGRYEHGMILETGSNITILDSDMVYGDTIKYAMNKFSTTHYSVALKIDPTTTDLIDIEDLIENNSLMSLTGKYEYHKIFPEMNEYYFNKVSYLYNKEFFTKRTSLSDQLYDPINEYINKLKYKQSRDSYW